MYVSTDDPMLSCLVWHLFHELSLGDDNVHISPSPLVHHERPPVNLLRPGHLPTLVDAIDMLRDTAHYQQQQPPQHFGQQQHPTAAAAVSALRRAVTCLEGTIRDESCVIGGWSEGICQRW